MNMNMRIVLALVALCVWNPAPAVSQSSAPETLAADSVGEAENNPPPSRFIQSFSPINYSRYNRVESVFAGFAYSIIPVAYPTYTLFLKAGYGFGNREARYLVGFERLFGDFEEWTARAQFGDETWSNDYDLVSPAENIVSTVIMRRDYRDYYRRRGGEVSVDRTFDYQHLTLHADVSAYRYWSMGNETNWSLWGPGEPDFRLNPAVGYGNELRVALGVTWDTRLSEYFPQNAWLISLMFERGVMDFEYNGLDLRVRKFFQFGYRQRMVLSARAAARDKLLDERLLFDAGGVGTLRGYGFKTFIGNRLTLFSADYYFGGALLQQLPLQWIPLYEGTALVLFTDSGMAQLVSPNKNLINGYAWPDRFKTSVGCGLSFAREALRVDFARRLDQGRDNWSVLVRLMRSL